METIVLSLAIIIGAPAKKEPPKEEKGIVGVWIPQTTTLNGKEGKPFDKGETRHEFTADGKQILRRVGSESKGTTHEYKVDATANPATIDITLSTPSGRISKLVGIYKIEGDTLTIVTRTDDVRPTKFEANDGARQMMTTFKREKKKD